MLPNQKNLIAVDFTAMSVSKCIALTCTLFFFLYSNAQVVAGFSMDKAGGCSPINIKFTDASSGTSANTKYSWDFGNGNMSSLKNPSAIFTEEKTYTVTLTITEGSQTSTQTKTITVYKKPSVDFSVNAPKICLPQAVQLIATASPGDGYLSTYQWDFGDGTTQQGYSNQISHYYTVEQKPAISLMVTNSYGCSASISKPDIVEIMSRMDPEFIVDKNQLCSLDQTIQLTNNSTGAGTLFYSWNFGDGSNSIQTNPNHQFTKKGVYNISLTVSNTDGCSATSSSQQINAAYFNTDFSNRPLCRELSFTASSFLYPTSSLWQFGDGTATYSSYNTKHVYSTAGNYSVMLVNTYNSCKDTVTKIITVQDQVNFNSIITMPPSVCQGSNVNFTAGSSTSPSSMNWNFGDGNSYNSYSNSTSHSYSQPGTYNVQLTNTFGTCSETVNKTIKVNALPNPQGFVVDYGGMCGAPATVKFKDTTSGAVSWQWQLNSYGNSFSTQPSPGYNFTSDGSYSVWLTVTNAEGCSQSTYKTVGIYKPALTISYSYSSSPKGYYDCDSLTIKFAVNSNQNIQSYSWNLGNGQTSTEASPQVTYSQQGIYSITLNYVTESGCAGTATYETHVYGKPKSDFTYSIPCGNSLNLQFFDKSSYSDAWNWNFGDGGLDYYTAFPYHTYSDTGKYTVQFISHIGHCADTITKEIYANVLPSSITITKAETTCDGTRGTVSFDQRSVRASGGTWSFGDGTTIPFDSSVHAVKHTYTATGTYQVTLTSFYNGCTLTSSRSVIVLLKQNPIFSANTDQICANGSINVQITNLQTNPYTGNWQYGQYNINKFEYNNGNTFNGYANNSYYAWQYTTYSSTLQNFNAGVKQLRAIVMNSNNGCADTTNYINLQVNGPITGFKVLNNEQCFTSTFSFKDTSKSSTSVSLSNWLWDFGDGTTQNSSSAAQVSHVYGSPGKYVVRLTVTDAANCSSTSTALVYARGARASFTASGLYVPNVPLNTTVTFYNNTNALTTGSINYTWIYGDGTTSSSYNGDHTYSVAGVYTVMLIAVDPVTSCVDTAKQVITVKDFNTAFSFSASFLGTGSCPPVMVRINNLSVGFTRLLWDFGDGSTTTAQYYPSHIYQSPGKYKITLYTYGYNGLTGTYMDSIEVRQLSAQISSNIFQGCLAQTVSLSSVTQGAANYTWDFGDGNINTGNSPLTHLYSSAGIFTPRFIAKDNNGCATSAELNQKIVIDSLSIAIKGIPALVCDSALINFTPDVYSYAQNKLGTQLTYKWNFGTGNAADTSNQKNPSFRFTAPGSYTVKFTVTSPYGCIKQTTAVVTVNHKAKANIIALPEICEGSLLLYQGAANPSDNLQWSWSFGNSNTSTQQNPVSQTYPVAGVYTTTLIVTRNGCSDTSRHVLTVNPKPVVNALPKQQVLCLGDSVSLSASGGNSYQWTPATALSNATIANPKASPSTSMQYNVQVTTNKGCVSSGTVSITVAQPIDVQLIPDADICKGASIQLNASGATNYQWINNTNGLSNTGISNPIAKPNVDATYTVVGSDNYGCFKDTVSTRIAVHNLPTVNAGPDVETIGGIPYQLHATASADVISWSWLPGNDLSCTNCAEPMATLKMQTEYVVKVSNRWGCTAIDTVVIKLQCAVSHVYIPTAFTPGNDGKNDLFYVKGSGINIIRYMRIYNRWGELIFERTNFGIDDRNAAWDGKYKGQFVEAGTYVYLSQMQCISGELFTMKGTISVIR